MSNYKRFIPEGNTVFIGIDIHRNSRHLTAILEDEVVFSSSLPTDPEALLKFLKRCRQNTIRVL